MMGMQNIKDCIADYCSSEHFLFLESGIKEHAEAILNYWADHIPGEASASAIDETLSQMARLNMPVSVRQAIPHLLKEFYAYISSTGRIPQADQWVNFISQTEKHYLESFRNNGSVKGETFKKNYTDVGRNDPCPCGSGKKFKKCCMSLLG